MRDDGRTNRQHLAAVADKSAAARRELAAHPCPPVFRAFLGVFHRMSEWRGVGGFGPAPLTLHDVEVFERRMRDGRAYLPGELDLLKRLDATLLTAA